MRMLNADSGLYINGSDGFKPLCLPERGEDLQEGRQYVLTPLARLILVEEFGLAGLPRVVECIHRRVFATRLTTVSENLETKVSKTSVIDLPAQDASFRYGKNKFVLDLAKLVDLAPFYADSHKLPTEEEKWFETREQYPLARRLRGAPLNWWKQGCPDPKSGYSGPRRARAAKEIDLSILD